MKKISLVLVFTFMIGGIVILKSNHNSLLSHKFPATIVEEIVIQPVKKVDFSKHESIKLDNDFADSGLPEWVTIHL